MMGSQVRILLAAPNITGSVPDTWVTFYSGGMGNTFAPKGLARGLQSTGLVVEVAEIIIHESMKPTSQISRLTCLIPTLWPANTVLRLIFCRLKQMRPHVVTVKQLVAELTQPGSRAG
jgi:hypothetical protein